MLRKKIQDEGKCNEGRNEVLEKMLWEDLADKLAFEQRCEGVNQRDS